MDKNPDKTTRFVHRIAVSGIVFLLVLAANSGLFAAQCGALPKGWKPVEMQGNLSGVSLLSHGDTERPAVPGRAPCKCTGASCNPAAPAPAPERGVVSSAPIDAIVGCVDRVKSVRSAPEFPDTVNSELRDEVVLGVFRPPCGV